MTYAGQMFWPVRFLIVTAGTHPALQARQPRSRPAPALARYDKISTERAGDPAPAIPACPGGYGG